MHKLKTHDTAPNDLISYTEALSLCLNAAPRITAVKTVSLHESVGRICAVAINAPLDVQPFDNAAMDGYALRHADIAGASASQPANLRVCGKVAAGDHPDRVGAIAPGACVRIMTGAPVPAWADTVIPYEHTREDQGTAYFTDPLRMGANIRRAGTDFKKGAPVLNPGQRIGAQMILPLATLGIARLSVLRRPKVAFISTGRELIDDPDAPLQPGQIYNSNRAGALAMLDAVGADIVSTHTIADDPDAFQNVLQQLSGADGPDIIISSGAVSAGDHDFIRPALEKAGAEILYHKIKIRPGKPNLLARLADGRLYFGLPGNPVATAAGLRFLVIPTLRRMGGMADETPIFAHAVNAFEKPQHFRMFLKGHLHQTPDGQIQVEILKGQDSFMVSPFLRMNCWIDAPEGTTHIAAGDRVHIYPILSDTAPSQSAL